MNNDYPNTSTYIEKNPGWNFDNSYSRLPETFYRNVNPDHVPSPKLVAFNNRLADSLGLDKDALQSDYNISFFAGNLVPEGAFPLAQAYAGHQFGYFTMLGDGRALLMGEHITQGKTRVDIQLKGSGQTPFSRRGDGKAALGPMLREYIISEAMYALGIPTTRSLAVVTTGEPVYRENVLPGAVLTRVASSHIRVGTFQYAAKWASKEELKALADYTLERHFNYIDRQANPYTALIKEVVNRQAELIAKWMLVGFIHGVMNTDNMALSGETIDYGPCAFMDTYDPATVFSSIDREGRYAYGNQPTIAVWNLARFAETLLPLLHVNQDKAVDIAEEAIGSFSDSYNSHWLAGMRAKLGIFEDEGGEEDEALISDLLDLMKKHKADYTNTFRMLTFDISDNTTLFETAEFAQWKERWQMRVSRQNESSDSVKELMKNNNPAVIPRNYRVEEALEAAVEDGDYTVMNKLLYILSKPFAHSSEQEEYTMPPIPSACPYQTFCGT